MKFSKNIALFILMFDMFITFSAIGVIVPIMPSYLKTFGAAGQVLGFIIAIIAFAQFVFSPIAGNLSDRYGRKNLIIFGLVVNGLSQICFGFIFRALDVICLSILYRCWFSLYRSSRYGLRGRSYNKERTRESNGLAWCCHFTRLYDWTRDWWSSFKCQLAFPLLFWWFRYHPCRNSIIHGSSIH